MSQRRFATIASCSLLALAVAGCAAATTIASAKDNAPADQAAATLAQRGTVAVKKAGPYVEEGTFLIQVAVKLGVPSVKLPDGTWLYRNFQVDDSDATGTLVVRFHGGRVRDLTLVTPVVATAMMTPKTSPDKVLVANR